jgi:hypothetical protein
MFFGVVADVARVPISYVFALRQPYTKLSVHDVPSELRLFIKGKTAHNRLYALQKISSAHSNNK